ncbi:hypothetical protein JAAARDRAFT_29917 [Jaapia argillacea MUCL 33604]|uniref:ferroxidase n=1 Tax=Jaapia argillacea MUCL 33604 TaxID=933084 RepID=A0A067QCJ0_9AGAM|nr:hypothetical protein JAAARDRAFT_29917 [Jaapia argillacea MUCL 33604]
MNSPIRSLSRSLGRRTVLKSRPLSIPAVLACRRAAVSPPYRPPRRNYATPPPQTSAVPWDAEFSYHAVSDVTMSQLLDELERLVDEQGEPEWEVEYSSGVLTLKLGDHGTYVVNKQPPNKQIWLSSPLSGPKRYDYIRSHDAWIYSRDQKSLGALLEEELSQVFGEELQLGLQNLSKLLSR